MEPSDRRMDRATIDDFLSRRGTGVLALAKDDIPYAVPVSYGYEAAAGVFYLRLARRHGDRRAELLDGPSAGRIVVYDRVDDEWYSVIAAGELEAVHAEDLTPRVAKALRRAEPPLVELVDDDAEFHIYRLSAEELTGRTTAED